MLFSDCWWKRMLYLKGCSTWGMALASPASLHIRMYGSKDVASNLNKLRCSMASCQKSKVPGKKLPPTEDSFLLHVQRVAFQLRIWKLAHIGLQELGNPTENGWQQESGRPIPKAMSQGCSAPELLNDLICECSNTCSDNCVCVSHKHPCVPACGCNRTNNIDTCSNKYSVLPETIDSEDE